MVEYYIEIKEDIPIEEMYRPVEMVRKYVTDKADAESVYATEITAFGEKKTVSTFVEMNHSVNTALNEPCVFKPIINGKVVDKEK